MGDLGIMKTNDVASRTLRGDQSCAVTTETSGVLATLLGQNVRTNRVGGSPPERGVESEKLYLDTDCCRAFWKGKDVGLTLGEYNIVQLLASEPGKYLTYRALYDRLRGEGFVAGYGAKGYWANVRSAIKRIRQKFWRATRPLTRSKTTPALATVGESLTSRSLTSAIEGLLVD